MMIVQGFIKGIAPSSMASLPLSLPSLPAMALAISSGKHGRHQAISSRLYASESPLDNMFDEAAQSPTKRKRRVRYAGKYPRNFNEKYKELQGDEVTVQKVLNKGMTPAGQHVPILLEECLHHLGLLESTRDGPPTVYVDCTIGYGGHSSQVLKRLLEDGNTNSRLICFDRDPVEIVKATERLHKIVEEHGNSQFDLNPVTIVNRNFREVRRYLKECSQNDSVGNVTALLADLGLSSMQMDDAARGFTYKREGPLDMRMAGTEETTESAYDLLSRLTVQQLTKMLQENSDEEHAQVIAQAILGNKRRNIQERNDNIPSTTVALAKVVRDAVQPLISPRASSPKTRLAKIGNDSPRDSSAGTAIRKQLDSTVARVMQAIRIAVNSEFESLEELLQDLPLILAPGGRAVFLTFHSGEDRRIKKAFKSGFKNGIYSSWSRDVVRPTAKERRNNPRSSCCKLRWAVRSDKVIASIDKK